MPSDPLPDKRTRIVTAALDFFEKRGVAHTRMADVAKKAGVNQALLQYHFPDLDSIYEAVVTRIIDERVRFVTEKMIAIDGNPLLELKTYLRSYFEWTHANPGRASIFIYFFYLASFKDSFRNINRARRATARDRIEKLIYRAIEKGQIPTPADAGVDKRARQVHVALTGAFVSAATEADIDPEEETASLWDTVRLLLGSRS